MFLYSPIPNSSHSLLPKFNCLYKMKNILYRIKVGRTRRNFLHLCLKVVKGYDGGQMKASDWSKNYANHLVTSLNDRSDQKWSNQNGESSENHRLWNVIG